jgi:hypothetical protein
MRAGALARLMVARFVVLPSTMPDDTRLSQG